MSFEHPIQKLGPWHEEHPEILVGTQLNPQAQSPSLHVFKHDFSSADTKYGELHLTHFVELIQASQFEIEELQLKHLFSIGS